MGGAYTALADDFSGAFYNPAGPLSTTRTRMGLGYQYVKMDLEGGGTGIPMDETHVDGLYMGFAFCPPFIGVLKDRIAIGYNFYQPVSYAIDINIPEASRPQFVLLESYPRANVMLLSAAIDLIPGALIGVGMNFTADLGGGLDLKPGIRGVGGTDSILTEVDQESQPVVALSTGLLVECGEYLERLDGLRFGFTWRESFAVDLGIPVTIILGTIPLQLDFTSKFIYTPEQYTWGLAYRFSDDLLLSADLSYNRWSRFEAPTLKIYTDIDIPLLPIALKEGVVEDQDCRDTISGRLGVEYRAWQASTLDLTVRGGYGHEPSPLPAQTGWSNFLDGDKHIFSTGAAVMFRELFGKDLTATPVTFHGTIQCQLIKETLHVKDPDIREENPGYPRISGRGRAFMAVLGFTVEYGGSGK